MALFDNCVAAWKLSDLTDATGRGNTLTNNNSATFNTGKIGNALYTTAASSQYLSIASNSDVQTGDVDFTIAFWFYQTAVPVDTTIISKDDTGSNREYLFEIASNSIKFTVWRGGVAKTAEDSPSGGLTAGTWHSCIGYHDATADTVNIQIDDRTPVSTATGGALDAAGSAALQIGARTAISKYWDGRIDDVNIFKKVFSSQDRTDWYNGGTGIEFGGGTTPVPIKSYDSFTDTDGTALTSHVGEVGASWTYPSYQNSGFQIINNRLVCNNTGSDPHAAYAYSSAVPYTPDYRVSAYLFSPDLSTTMRSGVVGRLDTAAETCYLFRYIPGTTTFELGVFAAGTFTSLATDATKPISSINTRVKIELRMRGSSLEGYVDGVLSCSATDGSITAAGRGGVRGGGSASGDSGTSGWHLEDFVLDYSQLQIPKPMFLGI